MSRLDDLKHALASAGYSPEQIADAEQSVLNTAIVSGLSVERVAGDMLLVLDAYGAFRVMHDFQAAMQQLVTAAGESQSAMAALSQGIMELANIPDAPTASKMVTERTPYYQKNKQKWWK